MRESVLFGTMFGLGAGAVLVGVTVSRLVVGQAPEKSAREPPAVAVETAPPAVIEPPRPPVVSSVPPGAEIALSGQHRPLPRKHRRSPAAEKPVPRPAPVAEETASTASIPKREAPIPAPPPAPIVEETAPPAAVAKREEPSAAPPPRAQVEDPPSARDAPIAIVRGGVGRTDSPAPGAHIIQVEPRDR